MRRLLRNPEIVGEELWAQLRPVLLRDWMNRDLVVVLDGTPQGKDVTVVTLGVVAHGRTLPLGNRVMPQRTKWETGVVPAITPLCAGIAAALPPGATVTLVADRGLSSAKVIDLWRRLGWHWVLRINGTQDSDHRMRYPDGDEDDLWSLVDPALRQGVEPGAISAYAGWRDGVITVRCDPRYEEPWVLFSDRPGGGKRVQEYRKRQTIEATVQDLKRRGWQVEGRRLRLADRIERLLIAVDLASWWIEQLGVRALRHGQRRQVERARHRTARLMQLGRGVLANRWTTRRRVPLPFRSRDGAWRYPAYFARPAQKVSG